MIRQLPLIPTVFVLAAAAVMVALGFWQLGRADEKAQLLALYEAALIDGEMKAFPSDRGGISSEDHLFHPTAFECTDVLKREAIAGRSDRGAAGYAHIARCQTGRGPADVLLGWSRDPNSPTYEGGPVTGLIVRGGADGARVQMDQPIEALAPLAKPDPSDLPNNHLAYAGQWFFFALTALAIYFFAVRAKLARRD